MEYIIVITGLIIVAASIYIATVQRIKANKYRKLYEDKVDEFSDIELKVKAILATIKKIDNSGAFENDDEVGAVFKGIRDILFKNFNQKVTDEKS